MSKVAFITDITGQDGAFLAKFLLKKGYIVHGLKQHSSLFNSDCIDYLYQDQRVSKRVSILHHGHLADLISLIRIDPRVQRTKIRANPQYRRAADWRVRPSPATGHERPHADSLGAH